MKTKLLVAVLISLFVISVASAGMIIPANDRAKENAKAPENSPVIGENWDLERIDLVHYAKPENPGKPAKTETCYKLLGVSWKSLPVNYIINPGNPQGLSEDFVTNAISTSAETWDSATSNELFNNIYSVDYSARYRVQDFKNAIVFGDYPSNNVIAVTSYWVTKGKNKQIVEFDIIFNTRFNWGDASINPEVMDLQNIATHELGHGVGLDDIYSSSCSEVTMYGYSTEGETKARTLEQPDITGIRSLYGI